MLKHLLLRSGRAATRANGRESVVPSGQNSLAVQTMADGSELQPLVAKVKDKTEVDVEGVLKLQGTRKPRSISVPYARFGKNRHDIILHIGLSML